MDDANDPLDGPWPDGDDGPLDPGDPPPTGPW